MEKIWLKNYQPGVPEFINPDSYLSVVDLFESSCEKFKNRHAFTNFGTTLSFKKIFEYSTYFAAYLQNKLGCRKGERIAIMMPNCLQYPVIFFGALRAGLTVTAINPLYTAREFTHQINDSGAEVLVVLSHFAHVAEASLPHTKLKHIIVTNLEDLFPQLKSIFFYVILNHVKRMIPKWHLPKKILFKNVISEGQRLKFSRVNMDAMDVALLQYTGGTTGVSKAAILTHRNLLANLEQITAWIKPTISKDKQEIAITPLPLYHIFSFMANCLLFFKIGAHNVLITNPRDIRGFIKELKRWRFTFLTGVNTLFRALLNHREFVDLDFSHLKIALGGGAALQHVVAEQWQKATGKVLLEGYGLTEASPVVCVMPLNIKEYNGSIGFPVPSTEISIRDENSKEVSIGEAGELWVRGPQVMQGYWHHPEENLSVLTEDGWLKTGDIAKLDEEGYVYLVDRKKDMILVSGFNVYPNEVEDEIANHPKVLEVAVIGIPDKKTGEAVKAVIVRKDPSLTTHELILFCRERLTNYKLPTIVEFRDSLPKSPVGKILRRELK